MNLHRPLPLFVCSAGWKNIFGIIIAHYTSTLETYLRFCWGSGRDADAEFSLHIAVSKSYYIRIWFLQVVNYETHGYGGRGGGGG